MVYLVILLLISHIVVLYILYKHIEAYKLNQYNYISTALKKIDNQFLKTGQALSQQLTLLQDESNQSLNQLASKNNHFIRDQKQAFTTVTNDIKQDYTSLTNLVKKHNSKLNSILIKTNENIAKNKELLPLLIDSNKALENVYSKIKVLCTNYEKSITDVKKEMENTLYHIEQTLEGKLKQMATNGEKTLEATVTHNTQAVTTVKEHTNKQIKAILQQNEIKQLKETIEYLNNDIRQQTKDLQNQILATEKLLLSSLKQNKEDDDKKKGFFNF